MRIGESSIHCYTLPYSRPVHWFNSAEDGGTFVLLRIVSEDGFQGVAEAPIKPTWSGVSPRSIAAAIEDLFIPELRKIDVMNPAEVAGVLAPLSGEPSCQDADRQCVLHFARGGGTESALAVIGRHAKVSKSAGR